MEKKELEKLNTLYVEYLNTMDALCERMGRKYLYMDNFSILRFGKANMVEISELLLFNMLRQESVFELFRKCVESATKVRKENLAWLQELIEKDNEVQTQYVVDSLLKSNGMKREGQ